MKYLLLVILALNCFGEKIQKISLVLDYDQQVNDILGEKTTTYINDIGTTAKIIFKNEFNIDLDILSIRKVSISSTDYSSGLKEYKEYVNNNKIKGTNLYHLIRGDSIGISALGLSYQDGICTEHNGISTSKLSSFNLTIKTIIHEILHTLGAEHDDLNVNIMNSNIQNADLLFNKQTKSKVNNFIKKSCISNLKTIYPNIIWKANKISKIKNISNNYKTRFINNSSQRILAKSVSKTSKFILEIINKQKKYYLINKLTSKEILELSSAIS